MEDSGQYPDKSAPTYTVDGGTIEVMPGTDEDRERHVDRPGPVKTRERELTITRTDGGNLSGQLVTAASWLNIHSPVCDGRQAWHSTMITATAEGLKPGKKHTAVITFLPADSTLPVEIRASIRITRSWTDSALQWWKEHKPSRTMQLAMAGLLIGLILVAAAEYFLPRNWLNAMYNKAPVLEQLDYDFPDAETLNLNARATDPDGNPENLNLRWLVDEGNLKSEEGLATSTNRAPEQLPVSIPGQWRWTFTNLTPGQVPVSIPVEIGLTDEHGGQSSYQTAVNLGKQPGEVQPTPSPAPTAIPGTPTPTLNPVSPTPTPDSYISDDEYAQMVKNKAIDLILSPQEARKFRPGDSIQINSAVIVDERYKTQQLFSVIRELQFVATTRRRDGKMQSDGPFSYYFSGPVRTFTWTVKNDILDCPGKCDVDPGVAFQVRVIGRDGALLAQKSTEVVVDSTSLGQSGTPTPTPPVSDKEVEVLESTNGPGASDVHCWVDVSISASGRILKATGRPGGTPEDCAKAVKAVRERWKFSPAIKNGKPVAGTIGVPVDLGEL